MVRMNGRRRRAALFALLAAALLTMFVRWRMGALRDSALSQQAADRYAGQSGRSFVQLSIFFHPGDRMGEFSILLLEETLRTGLRRSGSTGAGAEDRFPCALSASGYLNVQSDRGTFPLQAIGVGGDFFLFHPFRLRYGSLMDIPAGNWIVVNDRAAWLLFGGLDVVGLPVRIGGDAYVVSGVVSLENDRGSQAALGNTDCMIFVPFPLLDTGVTCCEVVLPEPVEGYGEALVDSLGMGDTVNNSARFTTPAIWNAILALPQYNMVTTSALLPYWENAARNTEMRLILWTMLLYFCLTPVLAALSLLLVIPPAANALQRIKGKKRQ